MHPPADVRPSLTPHHTQVPKPIDKAVFGLIDRQPVSKLAQDRRIR